MANGARDCVPDEMKLAFAHREKQGHRNSSVERLVLASTSREWRRTASFEDESTPYGIPLMG